MFWTTIGFTTCPFDIRYPDMPTWYGIGMPRAASMQPSADVHLSSYKTVSRETPVLFVISDRTEGKPSPIREWSVTISRHRISAMHHPLSAFSGGVKLDRHPLEMVWLVAIS